jgi:hypothetical protein
VFPCCCCARVDGKLSICRCYIPICIFCSFIFSAKDVSNDEWFFFRGALRRKKGLFINSEITRREMGG